MSSHLRQSIRTSMNCQIKICHPSFGEIVATTEDLSDEGVFIKHPDMIKLKKATLLLARCKICLLKRPS